MHANRANGMEQLLNNSAMPMDADEAIDLTEDSPLPPQFTAKQNQEDQAHRRRIMAYAAAVNAQNGFNGSGTAKALAGTKRRREAPVPSSRPQQQQPEQIVILSDDEDDVGPGAAPKRQLLAHSTHSSAGHAHPSSHNAGPSHGLSVGPGRPGMPLQGSAAAQAAAADPSHEQQQQQASSGAALMAQLARERMEREQRRQQQQQQHGHALASSSSAPAATQLPEPTRRDVSVLTYNIWFNEELALEERMKGVSQVIHDAGYPDFIMLQEVTQNIYSLLSSMPWWERYTCSRPPLSTYFTVLCARRDSVQLDGSFAFVPFTNSCMGRGLQYARCRAYGLPLIVATSHLESPMSGQGLYVEERRTQLQQAVQQMHTMAQAEGCDVIYGGDLNWNDGRDGRLALPDGWIDSWAALRPDAQGFTYHSAANLMLESKYPGARLDRVLCRLGTSFEPVTAEVLGTQPIPGVCYIGRSGKSLPVLPSDHFALLVQLRTREGVRPVLPTPPADAARSGSLLPFTGTGRLLGSS